MRNGRRVRPASRTRKAVGSAADRAARFGRRPGALALVAVVAITVTLASALVALGATGYVQKSVKAKVVAVKHVVVHPKKKHTAVAVVPSRHLATMKQYGCGGAVKIKVRFHYKLAPLYARTTGGGGGGGGGYKDKGKHGHTHSTPVYSPGAWSKIGYVDCATGIVVIGPEAMEGNLYVDPGRTLLVGYTFSLPWNHAYHRVTVSSAQVVFTPRCGQSPSSTYLPAPILLKIYNVNTSLWTPDYNQFLPVTFQGSVVVPNLCNGGSVRFDQGGTFSAAFQVT